MPEGAPLAKLKLQRLPYGAEGCLKGGFMMRLLQAVSAEGNRCNFSSCFDDPAVIAGQGTIGLEILEQCPDIRSIVILLAVEVFWRVLPQRLNP